MAAERCNVTQPTLTRDIARLEARLGGRLFERLPDGVRLTPLGETALGHARRILAAAGDAERAVDATRSGRSGAFRIASRWNHGSSARKKGHNIFTLVDDRNAAALGDR